MGNQVATIAIIIKILKWDIRCPISNYNTAQVFRLRRNPLMSQTLYNTIYGGDAMIVFMSF